MSNITFNSDTIGFLMKEVDTILTHAEITAGMADDLSNFLNALSDIDEVGTIVIIPNDDNLGDDWEEFVGPNPVPPYNPVMA